MAGVTKPESKGAYDQEGRRKYLSHAEGQKFVQHATMLPRSVAIFCLTIYYTGCRPSEALALRRQDIDAEAKTLRIRTLKKRGKHEIRRLPIPTFLVGGLLNATVPDDEQSLWPFSRTTGWRIVKAVMMAAQISGIHATAKGLRRARRDEANSADPDPRLDGARRSFHNRYTSR